MSKKQFVADVTRRYERNRLKENNLSPSTEQKFGNTTVQLTKPSIIDKRLKDLKGGHRVRARLTALQEDDIAIAASFKNTEITQDAKDQLKDYYINRFKNFQLGSEASRESQRDKGSLYRATRQNILNSFAVVEPDEEDREIFYDYLITNVKLYFDRFEGELSATPSEPTTPEYDEAADKEVEEDPFNLEEYIDLDGLLEGIYK